MVARAAQYRSALGGATVNVNCSASDETIGKEAYRRELIAGQSARLIAGYVYANAGEGESTTDVVFGGHNIIAENGTILKESERYHNEIIYSEFDIRRLVSERRKNTTFQNTGRHLLLRSRSRLRMRRRSLPENFRAGHSSRPTRRRGRQGARRSDDPGHGAEEASGPHPCADRSRGYLGRPGLHAGPSRDGACV